MIPFEAQKAVYDFFEDIELNNRNHDFTETEYNRGKKNYERIVKRLETITLPDPYQLKFQTLSTREIKEYIIELMCKIFGSSYKDKIEENNRLIRIAPINKYFDAITESNLQGNIRVPKTIYISNKCFSIQVVSTSHEHIHCMLAPYETDLYNSIIGNIHYHELLPIIVEYIICYELSQILKEEDLETKHRIIRLDHGKNLATERRASQLLDSKIRSINSASGNFMKKYIEYQEHNAFGYIISDMYALHLLDIYKDNRDTIISIIKSIIAGEKSIKDLINFFNLSLTNMDIITKYNQNIDQISLAKRK